MWLPRILKVHKSSIQGIKWNILEMSQIVSWIIANLSWIFHENPLIHFPVMLLVETQLHLVWGVWHNLVRDEAVKPYVFISFCQGVASCELNGKDISCQKGDIYGLIQLVYFMQRDMADCLFYYWVTSLRFIWRSKSKCCSIDVHIYFNNAYTIQVQHC